MLFSRDWLARYVELPEPAAELARRLTFAGFAVEGVEEREGDAIFDVDVTTNRPDAMNHLGLARELAVFYDRPLRPPEVRLAEASEPASAAARVAIEEPQLCSRYAARVVRGVTVGESPEWLRRSLAAIGQRSINNVVDVTNFVLWELGQPLHAFDLARLAGAVVAVRRARPGERLTTLDGVARALDPTMLVIADAARAVGLAGVMGGAETEVTAATRDVLLESAHFDRQAVRATARRAGLHTDASHRFERGADLEACTAAADRAAALLAEVAGGEVLAGVLDVRTGSRPVRRGRIELGKLAAFAGAGFAAGEVVSALAGLGFAPAPAGGKEEAEAWEVTVPSWRYFDFEPRPWVPASSAAAAYVSEVYPADLYEEVLRIRGFERVPAALPAVAGADAPGNPVVSRRARIRRHLAACGYAEAIHYAFGDPAADAAFPSLRPEARPLRLANPLSERYAVLRRSLVPDLVASARFNQRRGAAAVRLFEVARVFFARDAGAGEEAALPDQPETVALVCGGRVGTPWDREAALDLFDLKGAVESLAELWEARIEARIESRLEARAAELPGLLPGASAELYAGGERVGYLGQVAEEEGYPLFVAELAADALAPEPPGSLLQEGEGAREAAAAGLRPRPIEVPSRFPSVGADLTLTHPLAVPWREIDRAIAASRPPDLVAYGLTDRYRGTGVPEGAVNTTIHFVYNAGERSLTQEEVNERQLALARELEARFGWKG